MTILAKSKNSISLNEHSKNVSLAAETIARKILIDSNDEITNIIRYGALLHDIGKSPSEFQKILKGKIKKSKNKFRHNEIGWAFLQKYLHIPGINEKNFNSILDMVYWHHGISNKMNEHYSDDIIKTVSEEDINTLIGVLENLVGKEFVNAQRNEDLVKTPVYYSDTDTDLNKNHTFCRMCLVFADRIVSKLEESNIQVTVDEINKHILKETLREKKYSIDVAPYSGPENEKRFKLQLSIAAHKEKTILIKAPGGFGKTLTGLIFSLKYSNKKLIWVCPRNTIAESIYDSIISELKILNISDVSVELYLTGEVKNKNHNLSDDFSADIIVTNIDNLLAPTLKDSEFGRLYSIIDRDVIFDEFHELVGEAALFAAFTNMMRVRHRLTDSKTILLSATDFGNISYLWDSIGQQTLVLPNEKEHYPAAHSKKFKLNVVENFEGVKPNTYSNLVIFNSIKESQLAKSTLPNALMLFHSEFEDSDKKKRYDSLMQNFGKNSQNIDFKQNVCATHIVQAALDISFQNLYESVMSPESTCQRIPRINRWGELEFTPEVTIFKEKDSKSESAVRDIIYSRNLTGLWFDYIKQYDGQELTTDELYVIYNTYNSVHKKVLMEFVKQRERESLKALSEKYPYKSKSENKKTNIITAGSNQFRSIGTEVFVIARKVNSSEYTDSFSVRIYDSIDKDFNESANPRAQILGVYTLLRNNNDLRFDFNDILDNKDKITIDELRRSARKSNTPYVRFDKIYDTDEYGLISEETLKTIKSNKK